jgi:hypothetical protein
MLERILKGIKLEGKAISVFLVGEVSDYKYKVYTFDSFEDLWRGVTERIGSERPSWYIPIDEKLSFVWMFSSQEGNELFKLHTVSLVNERGWEVELSEKS